MRFDPTINIPTIIALTVLIVSTTTGGISLYSAIDKRTMATEFAIQVQAGRIDKIETTIGLIKTEQATRTTELRAETRSDIREIKDMLDRLIFPQQQRAAQTRLKEWSK